VKRDVIIDGYTINLDALLKWASLAGTGGEAKMVIQERLVSVNGVVETRRTRKLHPGDTVSYRGTDIKIVSSEQGV
jgi:ribosome-associated protein